MSFFSNLKTWAVHTAWPTIESFLGKVTSDGLAAAAPFAAEAVSELTTQEAAALASGNTAEAGHILANVVKSTTGKVAAAELNVGTHDILAAVGAAIPATPLAT